MLRYVLGPSPAHSVTQKMAPGFKPAEAISMANKRQSKVRVIPPLHTLNHSSYPR